MPGWRNIPGRRLQLLLRLSLECLLSLQVFFEMRGHARCFGYLSRNAVEKLADARILTGLDFFSRPDRPERALMQHGNTVGDPECAGHLVGDDDNRHLERLLQ